MSEEKSKERRKRGTRLKVVALGLERDVLKMREQGRTGKEIVAALNRKLARQHKGGGKPQTVSKAALERYIRQLTAATVPAVHEPQAAQENAAMLLDFGKRFGDLDKKLWGWVEEAENAREIKVSATGESIDAGPNWQARIGVSREIQRQLGMFADVMERVYNAEQVADFQQAVVEAIREADPEVAGRVVEKMRERRSIRAAALLGAAA